MSPSPYIGRVRVWSGTNRRINLQQSIQVVFFGTVLDAVEQAVRSLEDNELFNAGKGAVFSATGKHELDASLMCGQSLKAGVVAGVTNVRNPITLARTVMEQSENVFLLGSGAEDFARDQKLAVEPDDYFFTDLRFQQLREAQQANKTQLDHSK